MQQAVSRKTALSDKNIANNLSRSFLSIQFLNAITQGNGVWEWELLDSCQKERERGAENALYFFLFFFLK